jgi:hypothetical protein
MGGVKRGESAHRVCRVHDEGRTFLPPRSRRNERVSLAQRRLFYTARTRVLLASRAAAELRTSRDDLISSHPGWGEF